MIHNDLLREPEQQLDPRVIGVWRMAGMLSVAVCAVLLAIIAIAIAIVLPWMVAAVLAGIAAVVLVVGITLVMVVPSKRYALYRWEITGEGVILRHGWLVRRLVLVPHSRIQSVDATSGPLLRRAGLASVQMWTAASGGSPTIPGLDADRAREVASQIAAAAGVDDAT